MRFVQKKIRRKDTLLKHKRKFHSDVVTIQHWSCNHWDISFSNYSQLFQHINSAHPIIATQRGGSDIGETLKTNDSNSAGDNDYKNQNDKSTVKDTATSPDTSNPSSQEMP